jgi:hypothetical protein
MTILAKRSNSEAFSILSDFAGLFRHPQPPFFGDSGRNGFAGR